MENMPEKQQARLDRLEETQVFQERLLAELHEALLAQQGDINSLHKQLHQAREHILRLEESLSGASFTLLNEKPPHY